MFLPGLPVCGEGLSPPCLPTAAGGSRGAQASGTTAVGPGCSSASSRWGPWAPASPPRPLQSPRPVLLSLLPIPTPRPHAVVLSSASPVPGPSLSSLPPPAPVPRPLGARPVVPGAPPACGRARAEGPSGAAMPTPCAPASQLRVVHVLPGPAGEREDRPVPCARRPRVPDAAARCRPRRPHRPPRAPPGRPGAALPQVLGVLAPVPGQAAGPSSCGGLAGPRRRL